MSSLLDRNLSYYTVPAAFLLLFIPQTYALLAGTPHGVSLAEPRRSADQLRKFDGSPADKATARRCERALAASSNGLETVGLFAAAVVAGNVAGVPTRTLNGLSLGYVASRAVYNYIYVIAQEDRRAAMARSPVWGVGIGIIGTLFVLAGRKAA